MKVLFTHSYFLRFDPKQWETQQPYAPYGTLTAAALIRQQGFDVSFFDVMFAQGPEDLRPVLKAQQPDVLVIYDDGFNYLTKMCLTNMREAAFAMAAMAKAMGIRVMISSSDSTDHFDEYLAHGTDVVLLGEAEYTVLEVLDQWHAGSDDLSGIAGAAFLQTAQVTRNPRRSVIRDLDALPLPAWDLINLKPYQIAWQISTGYFSINIGTTRGCPYKCNWCAKPIYGNRYNARTPEHVVDELLLLRKKVKYDHIWFCDDIFGLKPGWVKRFAELTKEHGLKLRFKIQSRADLLLEDAQIEPLAAAGCETVWMGAESGSQRILDAMDKGTTIAQIAQATAQLKKHGIRPAFFLQFGYPGETMDDIELTLDMVRKLMPEDIGISVSYPLPGTKFYETVKEQLVQKANWTDSDELALMFENTYPPEFYKQLHRYVHAMYRILRARHQQEHDASTFSLAHLNRMVRIPYYAWQEQQERRKLKEIKVS